jgi:hypothetical protein
MEANLRSGVIRHAGRNYLKLESECFANWRFHHTLIFLQFRKQIQNQTEVKCIQT